MKKIISIYSVLTIFFVCLLSLSLNARDNLDVKQKIYSVGVYEGNIRTADKIHGPKVRVKIENAEEKIILFLGSYEPVTWDIEQKNSNVELDIILHGYNALKAKVLVNGVATNNFNIIYDLSAPFEAKGAYFRELVNFVSEKYSVNGLDGFWGSYEAPSQGFVISNVQAQMSDKSLQQDYLSSRIDRSKIKPAYQELLLTDIVPEASFDDDGFYVRFSDGSEKFFPISLDVPNVSWPAGAAYNKKEKMLYGVTSGGEGFLYQYDINLNKWSILTSMQGNDVSGMIYDAQKNRLIMGCCDFDEATLLMYDLRAHKISKLPLSSSDFVGLSDLLDDDNGEMAIIPVLISKNEVLVKVQSGMFFERDNDVPNRSYVVDLLKNKVFLIDYEN